MSQRPTYNELACELLGEDVLPLALPRWPINEADVIHYPGALTDEHDRELQFQVCRLTDLPPNEWDGLDETQRIVWMRLALDSNAKSNKDDTGPKSNDTDVTVRLLNVYTDGLADERFEKAAMVLDDANLTLDEKLRKIDALLPIPSDVSAAKLGNAFGVSKTAVQKTSWYIEKRKGQKDHVINRRHTKHRERSQQYEADAKEDGD